MCLTSGSSQPFRHMNWRGASEWGHFPTSNPLVPRLSHRFPSRNKHLGALRDVGNETTVLVYVKLTLKLDHYHRQASAGTGWAVISPNQQTPTLPPFSPSSKLVSRQALQDPTISENYCPSVYYIVLVSYCSLSKAATQSHIWIYTRGLVSSPDPTFSQGERGEPSQISWACTQFCNSVT